MQAIKCELCGSNSFTKEDGYFVCDHCNTKYTLEEAKKLIVSGTVEVVTGNAEKERLLKNAETLVHIGKISEARNTYDQIISIYPDDVRGYVGKLLILIDLLDLSYSYEEYNQFFKQGIEDNYDDTDIFEDLLDMDVLDMSVFDKRFKQISSVKEIFELENIINKLSGNTYHQLIKEKWEDFDIAHNTYAQTEINNIECGNVRLFEKYKRNIPSFIIDYLNTTKANARTLEEKLNQYHLFSYLSKLLKVKRTHYREIDVDGYIRPEEIYKIVHFTPTELVCKSYGWFNDKAQKSDMLVTIELNNNNNLEDATIEIINICKNYEKETQTRNEINSLFSSILSNELVKELATKYNGNDKITKPICKEINIRIFTKCVLEESNNIHLTYYDKNKGSHSYSDRIYYQNNYISIIHNNTKDILTNLTDLLVFLRKKRNLCQHCGGTFKGIFNKICSKCGKPKDY